MRDPSTFEARLADAFEAYALGAPTAINARALAAVVATHRRDRRRAEMIPARLHPVSWRSALVVVILAALIVSGLFLAAALRRPDLPAPTGRLLAWVPTGPNTGMAYILDDDGTVRFSRPMPSRGCPQLVAGSDEIAINDVGKLRLESLDGRPTRDFDINEVGFERWSPDRRAIVLLDPAGAVSVVRFDTGTSRYGLTGGLAGALDAAVSVGGDRVVVAVPAVPVGHFGDPSDPGGQVDVHVLENGTDRVVYRATRFNVETLRLAITPDGATLAIVLTADSRRPRVRIVQLADGAARGSDGLELVDPGIPFSPISWSPDGTTLAALAGSTVLLYDAAADRWRETGLYFHGQVEDSRWSTAPGDHGPALAMLNEGHLEVYTPGGGAGRRILLFSAAAAFSPAGSTVASIGGSGDGRFVAGGDATVWGVDVWGDVQPRVIAHLGEPPGPAGTDPTATPCIDWLPGGGS